MLVQAGREGSGELASDDLEIIEREIRRIERSLQTFLDFARPPRLERSRHDLVEIVERAINLVRGRAVRQSVSIRYDRPIHSVQAEVDGSQLQQVLVNLVLNSLDVMPAGGQLEVGLQYGSRGVPTITVRDSGPGIDAGILSRLFEPFLSSKETGLGLGLVVSKRIVEEHGGTLRGGNRPEGGAAFVIHLPQNIDAA